MTIVDPLIPSRRTVAVIGHRGSRATHPENTIAAFDFALRAGADAVELDVVPTRDGVLAVRHDPVEGDFAELPESVPRFEEVVEFAAATGLFLDVEIKSYARSWMSRDALTRRVVEALHPLAGRVALRSFDLRILRAAHRIAPSLPRIALTRRSLTRWVEIATAGHARAISPHFWLVSPRRVRRAHEAGFAVYAWTVNRPGEWRRMLRAGVEGIITDDPAALARYLNQATADAGPSNRTGLRS